MSDNSPYAIKINYGNHPSVYVTLGSRSDPDQNVYPEDYGKRLSVWFFDRHTYMPTVAASFTWDDPTVVPEGMQEYLTSAYIMVFGCALTVPMQSLYQTLMDNGAGAGLLNLESLQTQVSYGTTQSSMYALISVPSSKIISVESARLLTQQNGGPPPSGIPQTIYYLAAQMVSTPGLGYVPQPLWV
ncbi:hypothetical protein [Nisaea sp.]|uniref:hypothetical protein n=1 Tax=Nisaea sp. TaxID=2024842 RepID=UPI003296FCE2